MAGPLSPEKGLAELRNRLSQLSDELLTQVLPATASALHTSSSPKQPQQQQHGQNAPGVKAVGAAGQAAAAPAGAGSSLQGLQAQAASHDLLLQHMQRMWAQVRKAHRVFGDVHGMQRSSLWCCILLDFVALELPTCAHNQV
jgi:hypothetical protein